MIRIFCLIICSCPFLLFAQAKDSIIYNIIHRDSVIYVYDTLMVTRKITQAATSPTKKKFYDPNNWWIGPSVGTYYSPYHGFDLSVGLGVWYYFGVSNFSRNKGFKRK